MELREAFKQYEVVSEPARVNNLRSTCLALRRGGVNTLEQLRELNACHPEQLTELRGIGPGRLLLIREILSFYDPKQKGGLL